MNDAPNTEVFIVEDSRIVRDALVDLLECAPGVSIVGSAEDAETAIAAISRHPPDYVVLDYQLAGGSAVDVLRAVRPVAPATVFIVLTNHATAPYRKVCVEAGANWFLDKSSEFAAVKQIITGLRTTS